MNSLLNVWWLSIIFLLTFSGLFVRQFGIWGNNKIADILFCQLKLSRQCTVRLLFNVKYDLGKSNTYLLKHSNDVCKLGGTFESTSKSDMGLNCLSRAYLVLSMRRHQLSFSYKIEWVGHLNSPSQNMSLVQLPSPFHLHTDPFYGNWHCKSIKHGSIWISLPLSLRLLCF